MIFQQEQHKKNSGIYAIMAMDKSIAYVGSANVLVSRFRRHKHHLLKGDHWSKSLQSFANEHGIHALTFEILEICEQDHLTAREQIHFENLKSIAVNSRVLVQSNRGCKADPDAIRRSVETKRRNGVYERVGTIMAERNRERAKPKPEKSSTPYRHSHLVRAVIAQKLNGNKNGLGKVFTDERKRKIALKKSIPILQFTLDNQFVKEWESSERAADALHLNQANISAVCNGKRNKCGGFLWRKK